MPVVVVTAPKLLIPLDEAWRHLRLDHHDEDELIRGLIATAQSHIDGPFGWLGRSLGEQTLELRMRSPHWHDCSCAARPARVRSDGVCLPYGPVISVEAVNYIDADGATQTVAADRYRLDGDRLKLVSGASWPSMLADETALRIRYKAGYPDTEAGPTLPAAIRHAMLLMIGHWYENRMAVTTASMAPMPMGAEALLSPYRVWGV